MFQMRFDSQTHVTNDHISVLTSANSPSLWALGMASVFFQVAFDSLPSPQPSEQVIKNMWIFPNSPAVSYGVFGIGLTLTWPGAHSRSSLWRRFAWVSQRFWLELRGTKGNMAEEDRGVNFTKTCWRVWVLERLKRWALETLSTHCQNFVTWWDPPLKPRLKLELLLIC